MTEVEGALGVIAYGYAGGDSPQKDIDSLKVFHKTQEGQKLLLAHLSLLHCTTEYPADFSDVNLKAIDTMREAFNLPVGLSDHTLGFAIPIAAVARGATIVEKHFTLDRAMPGPDHLASLSLEELATMIKSIREVEVALGDGVKQPSEVERRNLLIARRSLTSVGQVKKGEIFTSDNLTTKRPGTGVSATNYWNYLGTPSENDYEDDEQI